MSYYDYKMCRICDAAQLLLDYLATDYCLDQSMQEQMSEMYVMKDELRNGLEVIHSVLLDRL